jgi:hypothetical protein
MRTQVLSAVKVGVTGGFACVLSGATWITFTPPAYSLTTFGTYTFEGDTLTSSGVAPGISFSNFSYTGPSTPGFVAGSPGRAYTANNWNVTAIDPNNRYFTFTVAPQAGNQITISKFSFSNQRSSTGPVNFAIRSSSSNFSSDIVSGATALTPAFTTNQFLLSGFNNIQTPVEFRVYGFNASASTGTWRVDNVQLQGDITAAAPVPFEFSPSLGLVALGSWWGIRKLQKRLLTKN